MPEDGQGHWPFSNAIQECIWGDGVPRPPLEGPLMMDPVTNLRTPNNPFEASSDLHFTEGSHFPLRRVQASPFEIGRKSSCRINNSRVCYSLPSTDTNFVMLFSAVLEGPLTSPSHLQVGDLRRNVRRAVQGHTGVSFRLWPHAVSPAPRAQALCASGRAG